MEEHLTKEEVMEEIKKEREVEQNKRDAIQMANKLFKIVSNPEVINNSTPEQRHKVAIQNSKNFADAFPLVLAKMTRDLQYNEKAFRRFLDKLHQDPGKGMDGVIERQADYAKFLYIEESKRRGRHLNMKIANEIWNKEYQHMRAWVKKTKEQEKTIKSEFEEEQKKHVEERKQELFDWLQDARDQQQEEDPEAFQANKINLDELNADELSMSDDDELPPSLVDPTQKQNKNTIVSQVPSQEPQTEEEKQAAENYRKAYEKRLETERLEAAKQAAVDQEKLRQDMIADSLILSWKQKSSGSRSKKPKNQKKGKKNRRR